MPVLNSEGRLFAIGDIHGCPDELGAILKEIDPAPGDTVIFVGDYVDRGPSARDVIDLLIDFKTGRANTVFLKGNHEDMMLAFMGLPGHYGESFLYNGGVNTLESYGIDGWDAEEVAGRLPAAHLDFLQKLETSYLRPPFLFVHAGVDPLRGLEDQDAEDLLWIRQDFIANRHGLGHTVIFGHTPMRDILLDLPYKIGLDTGLVYGGKLSCVEFTEGRCFQVNRGGRKVTMRRIKALR
jgi:diadenosine tetraphosphatase ApaH/serine/threonine PP2A family protein phosphatase